MATLTVAQLFHRYADTFATRDVDAVVALHADDTVFQQHTGQAPVTGRARLHTAFTEVFALFPDLTFEVERTMFGADFWVLDWTLVAHAGSTRVDCLDVVTLDGAGLVLRKDTYVDLAPAR